MHCLIRGSLSASLLSAVFLSAGGARAQTPREDGKDLIEKARRMDEIAAQKVESEIRAAFRDADRAFAPDPSGAAERLRRALSMAQDDTALPQGRRDIFVRALQFRIRLAESVAKQAEERNAARVAGRNIRLEEDRRLSDQERITRSLDTIRTLRKEGRMAEAKRLAEDLARQHPDNQAVMAANRITGTADQVASIRSQLNDRDRRFAGAGHDVDRSAMPATTEVEFPRDWREKVQRRSKTIPLTDKEKAILKALDSTIVVNFKNQRFEDVIKFLSDHMGQPILLDREALREAQVEYDTPVSLETAAKGLAVRTVLRKVLSEFRLAYVIKDQTIEVTSALKAEKMMVTRTYFIGDILGNPSGLGGMLGLQLYGAAATQLQVMQQVNQIIDLIKSSLEPQTWEGNGGSGAISFHAPTMSLVVRQSAEVQGILAGSMAR
jgi:hypothetical protein